MNNENKPLLISLKPSYADLVFRGLKKAELRRRISENLKNRDVFVYVSSPVKILRGGFRVGQVWSGTPNDVWEEVSRMAGVSRKDFNTYYNGASVAFALEILDVWEYKTPRTLDDLRLRFFDFVVPQSYRYVKTDEMAFFKKLKRLPKTFSVNKNTYLGINRKCVVTLNPVAL